MDKNVVQVLLGNTPQSRHSGLRAETGLDRDDVGDPDFAENKIPVLDCVSERKVKMSFSLGEQIIRSDIWV